MGSRAHQCRRRACSMHLKGLKGWFFKEDFQQYLSLRSNSTCMKLAAADLIFTMIWHCKLRGKKCYMCQHVHPACWYILRWDLLFQWPCWQGDHRTRAPCVHWHWGAGDKHAVRTLPQPPASRWTWVSSPRKAEDHSQLTPVFFQVHNLMTFSLPFSSKGLELINRSDHVWQTRKQTRKRQSFYLILS